MTAKETIIKKDGAVAIVYREWLSESKATKLQNHIINRIGDPESDASRKWIQDVTPMYVVPRLQYFCGDDDVKQYTYGRPKRVYKVDSWMTKIRHVRDRIQSETGNTFDSCLLNYYVDGKHSIGAHSDKEALGPDNMVVTVSLGVTRKFVMRSIADKERIVVMLNHGDMMIMSGRCQELWTHEIPKQLNITESRISLTFRCIGDS